MNCLEARKAFVSFWQMMLDLPQRADFLDHLAGCSACDHSFRVFALTAPVLHSEYAPRPRQLLEQTGSKGNRPAQFLSRYGVNRWWAVGLAATMGAAAALALYISQPPRVTLEDAFQDEMVESNPDVQLATFNSSDNLFGLDDSDSGMAAGFNQTQPSQGSQDDFGG